MEDTIMEYTTEANRSWIEMAILCNMIVNEDVCRQALGELREDCFTDARNRLLFRALQLLTPVASERRFETLVRLLESKSQIDAVGGKGYVTFIYLFVPEGDVEGYLRLMVPRRKRAA
jgi:replicative DNA helicase